MRANRLKSITRLPKPKQNLRAYPVCIKVFDILNWRKLLALLIRNIPGNLQTGKLGDAGPVECYRA